MPLDRRAERLLAMLAATQGAAGRPETPAARRQALRGLAEMADDAGEPADVRDLHCPGPGGEIGLRLYAPPGAGEAVLPGLVFFHGGGWVAGDLATHDGLCRRLASAAGCRLIATHYRRAPEHPFPAAFDDALAATRWVAAHAGELGVDALRLAVGGDSVGGGLAAAVTHAARDAGGPRLALQVLICPILDAGSDTVSRAAFADGYFISRAAFAHDLAAYLPDGARADDPRISPLRAADLSRLPPAILHTAEFDPFRDEGEAYAAGLRDAGALVRCERHAGQIHYFYAMAQAIPAGRAAAALIGAQMREAFEAAAPAALASVLDLKFAPS
jgi:acetyl esterase